MSDKLSLIRRVIPAGVTQKIGRQILTTQKNSPHILFGLGVVGFGATVVLSSRATLRVGDILDKAAGDLNNINELVSNVELAKKYDYAEDDVLKDRITIYSRTTIDLVKLYGPATGVGLLTIFCFSKSHMILTKRNAVLVAAYAGLERAYSEYRKRVADLLDPEYERSIYQGDKCLMVYEGVNEEGKVVELEKRTLSDGRVLSQYARFFDETSSQWQKTAEYNFLFLRAQQSYANDLLMSRGHVFLNDVYDMLGLGRSQIGAITGWVLSKNSGDNYIDFGFMSGESRAARDFINGHEDAVLLDFNVDGLIYDKI